MSSNKTPNTSQELASWRRNIPSRSYLDQHRRASACAANQASGSSSNVPEPTAAALALLAACGLALAPRRELNRRHAHR
jgi:hypothetical protein